MSFNIVKWAALLTLLTLLGCGGGVRGNDYNVIIDPAFSNDDMQAIIDATDDWKGHIDGLRMWPMVGSCEGIKDATICVHLSSHAEFLTHKNTGDAYAITNHDDGGGEVWIDAQAIATFPTYLKQTAEHEMGHAMGLVHDFHHTLMNPHPELASPTVTCSDMTQWYVLRGLVVPACD